MTGEIDPFVQSMLDDDRTAATFGFTVTSAHGGEATAEFTVREEFANGHGICHGGVTFTLADTAFACAANSVLPGSVTADADITYLAPARVGDALVAHALVRHRSKRQSLVDVSIRVGDRVVAEYRGRAVVIPTKEGT